MKKDQPGKKSPSRPKRNPAKEDGGEQKTSGKGATGFSKKSTPGKGAGPRREEKQGEAKRTSGKDAAGFSKKSASSKTAGPRREEKQGEAKRTSGKDAAGFSKKSTSGKGAGPRREEKRGEAKRTSGKDAAGFSKKSAPGKAAGPRREEKQGGEKRPFWEPFSKKQPVRRAEPDNRPTWEPRPRPKLAAKSPPPPPVKIDEPMRLNKFIAHCGICARRQAAEYVKQGLVTVNGEMEPNPGYLVQPEDKVTFKGEPVTIEERKVYILMNKPKDVITTANDEKGRKTVLEIVGKKVEERIFPVGRLDRMTSGLLLLTNDGDLAKKLSHPKHKVQKFYMVTLDKPVHKVDIERIQMGLTLEDGVAQVDGIDYVEGKKNEIGIELHIGKNRIIRRIFEHLGYEVIKLDRTYYAGLTKKDIGRGHFRHLTEKEVIMLKHFK